MLPTFGHGDLAQDSHTIMMLKSLCRAPEAKIFVTPKKLFDKESNQGLRADDSLCYHYTIEEVLKFYALNHLIISI